MKWYSVGLMAFFGCLVALTIYGLVAPLIFGSAAARPAGK